MDRTLRLPHSSATVVVGMGTRRFALGAVGTALVLAIMAAPSGVGASSAEIKARGTATDGGIVFSRAQSSSGSNAIWTIKGDGTGLVELTHPPKGWRDEDPTWSNSRERIAFLRFIPNGKLDNHDQPLGQTNLMVMGARGYRPHRLTSNAIGAGNWDGVAWSPGDTRIAFTRYGNGDRWIWTIRPDGSTERRLTRGDNPAWSPDGTQIAFRQWQASRHRTELFVISADGGGQRSMAPGFEGTTYWAPAWSPDGRKIAFLGTPGEGRLNVLLYVVNRDGKNLRKLADGLSTKDTSRPAWSPDGSRLLIERGPGGVGGQQDSAFVINAAGGRVQRVARNTDYPEWSPDGRMVAFVRDAPSSSSSDLVALKLSGEPPRRIARQVISSIDW